MKIIDCRGLKCPKPVILTKKEYDLIDKGEFQVIVDNEAAKENVVKFVKNEGGNCTAEEKEGLYYLTVKKESSGCSIMDFGHEENLVIVVTTDKLGSGDDKLGEVLMKSYMYALSESDNKPKTIIFINGGVKLTTEGSEVLDSLNRLAEDGAEILSCGTCLDFYGLKGKLKIGSISNMFTIVEKMNTASKVVNI
jgi:selenium metabolism protein YedF